MVRNKLSAQFKTLMGIMHGSRAFVGPYQAALWITSRCNIRCIHCFYFSPHIEKPNLFEVRRARMEGVESIDETHKKLSEKGDAQRERTHALIDELLGMGTQEFLFTGIGEPFLHKYALEFMGRVKDAGCACIANTNGTLLDRAVMDELIKMDFDELRVTTMAGTREMYVRTHAGARGETFDALRENLLYLAERKAALGKRKPMVSIAYVVVADNHDGLVDFAKFASFVGADRVLYRPFDDVEDTGLAKLVPNSGQAASVMDQMSEAKELFASRRTTHNIDFFLKIFKEKLDTTALYNIIPCYYGWLSARIELQSGSVYPCCKCYEPLGNIHEKSFQEIWNGEAYRGFRREARKIHRRSESLRGCKCDRCANFTANLRVYRMLHPIKGRSDRIEGLTPDHSKDEGNL